MWVTCYHLRHSGVWGHICNGKRNELYSEAFSEWSWSVSHSRAAAAADGMLCVFVYVAGEGTLWEKLLAMVRINEKKIRVLSGLGQARMDTILLCENFLLSLVIFSIITVLQWLPPRTIPSAGEHGTNLERTGRSDNVVITLYNRLGTGIIPTCMTKAAARF